MATKKKAVKKSAARKAIKRVRAKGKKTTKKRPAKKSASKKTTKKCSCCGMPMSRCIKKAMKNTMSVEPTLIAFPRASDTPDTQF